MRFHKPYYEIHLPAADFVRKFGRRVKKAGGSYSHLRGHATRRIVKIPVREIDLACEAIEDCFRELSFIRGITAIGRGQMCNVDPIRITPGRARKSLESLQRKLFEGEIRWIESDIATADRRIEVAAERISRASVLVDALKMSPLCDRSEVVDEIERLLAEMQSEKNAIEEQSERIGKREGELKDTKGDFALSTT